MSAASFLSPAELGACKVSTKSLNTRSPTSARLSVSWQMQSSSITSRSCSTLSSPQSVRNNWYSSTHTLRAETAMVPIQLCLF